MSKYLHNFMRLNCAGDVMNSVKQPMRSPARRITEAMAIAKKVRRESLDHDQTFENTKLMVITNGNGLEAVLMAHLFNFDSVTLVTKKEHITKELKRVRGFTVMEIPKHLEDLDILIDERTIIVGCGNINYNEFCDLEQRVLTEGVFIMPHLSSMVMDAKSTALQVFEPVPAKLITMRDRIRGDFSQDKHVLSENTVIIHD